MVRPFGVMAVVLLSGVTICSAALQAQGGPTQEPVTRSLALAAVAGGAGEPVRLALRQGTQDLIAIDVPPGITRSALDAAIANALWHPNGRDVALGVTGPGGSFVVVFLEQPDGSFLAIDVSRVERVNIGAIGPDRTYPVRRTRPVEWRADRRLEGGGYAGQEAVQVVLRTEVRDEAGVRYRGAEPLIITRSGMPLWR